MRLVSIRFGWDSSNPKSKIPNPKSIPFAFGLGVFDRECGGGDPRVTALGALAGG